jgi:hypothetical protein
VSEGRETYTGIFAIVAIVFRGGLWLWLWLWSSFGFTLVCTICSVWAV